MSTSQQTGRPERLAGPDPGRRGGRGRWTRGGAVSHRGRLLAGVVAAGAPGAPGLPATAPPPPTPAPRGFQATAAPPPTTAPGAARTPSAQSASFHHRQRSVLAEGRQTFRFDT